MTLPSHRNELIINLEQLFQEFIFFLWGIVLVFGSLQVLFQMQELKTQMKNKGMQLPGVENKDQWDERAWMAIKKVRARNYLNAVSEM